ncbi:energy-coupling factor transporter transmembrane protein EcfT [Aureimonas flava]|uniref:Energy-coupling factor transporter transmembrane protein EcfT n=1 Tax=Aureimonas flava TaxID=2320271 RepID=A0A3A1WLW7_9HYPH|nr:energy-coupling factor transporter transmembrane protein EcfT [Aureimonas flava]RIY01356.1 energy-coupling factor transporter transmembrane protein EcfT [Aureimonas flava]
MIADLYRPGPSPLHRLPAAAKLAALAAIGTALFAVPSLALSLGALALASILFAVARLGWRFAGRSMKAVLPVVLLVGAFQVWFAGWHEGALFAARLAALLLLAGLVTATTRPSDMADTIARAAVPLRPLGVDPRRIGLAFGLAIRFVPVLAAVASDIREAQAARGLHRSVLALAVPLVLRTLKTADEVAEAIEARS